MTILFMHTIEGGFLAGDAVRGVTAYAYPTSQYAVMARRNPEKVANEMVEKECTEQHRALPSVQIRDVERIAQLQANAETQHKLSSHRHFSWNCPSMHHNRGDDICADCGIDLA